MSLTFFIEVMPDLDANVNDYDCYDDAELKAYRIDEWRFVGIALVVEGYIDDVIIDARAGDLWGVEYGTHFPLSGSYVRECLEEAYASMVKIFGHLSPVRPLAELPIVETS